MFNKDLHISDRDLLLMAEGELSTRRAAQVQTHLAACWNCRARMAEIEGTILDLARACRKIPDIELPHIAGPRALLSARLTEFASKSDARPWRWFGAFAWTMHSGAVCLALFSAALTCGLVLHYGAARGIEAMIFSLERGVLPDLQLTPGATRTVTIDDLCSSPHEEVVGQVTAPLRNQVLQEYGIANARAGEYEIDYLIAPGLGGVEDIRNLWPQPYTARGWNAYAKDALEERLHQLVCKRELDLAVAQQDISNDWIAAYKKYFQTDRPLTSNADLDSLKFQAVSMADIVLQ